MWMKMSVEHWWNDTDRSKLTDSEKNLVQCHSVHENFHVDWPGTEHRPPGLKVKIYLNYI
jgi:hypothetical protein